MTLTEVARIALGTLVTVILLVTTYVATNQGSNPCFNRVDVDGRLMVCQDLNGDGQIIGDIEFGS